MIKRHYHRNNCLVILHVLHWSTLQLPGDNRKCAALFTGWTCPDVVLILLVRSGPFPLSPGARSPLLYEELGVRIACAQQRAFVRATEPFQVLQWNSSSTSTKLFCCVPILLRGSKIEKGFTWRHSPLYHSTRDDYCRPPCRHVLSIKPPEGEACERLIRCV